jgi:DNA transformation protein and related proteins
MEGWQRNGGARVHRFTGRESAALGQLPPNRMRGTMSVTPAYRDFVTDQIGRIVPITARVMFGGVGLYSRGLFFGLIDEDRLYLKVDDLSRGDFESIGSQPFQPYGDAARPMQYYELPADVLETPDELRPWIDAALAAASRAKRR